MKSKEIAYIILIFILGFLVFKKCEKNNTKPIEILREITKIDTLLISDTVVVPFEKKVFVTKWLVPDTIKETFVINNDTINVFETEIKDSIIEGNIISNVKGFLVSQKLVYKPLVPKEIRIIDSVIITKPKLFCEKKNEIFIGAFVSGNENSFDFSPTISLKNKKDILYSIGYGIINKKVNIGLQKKISNPFRKKQINKN
tara:strand:+ start:150 stop:749 length:600 start_codon:yes stop_codon:yes gene_type:complete